MLNSPKNYLHAAVATLVLGCGAGRSTTPELSRIMDERLATAQKISKNVTENCGALTEDHPTKAGFIVNEVTNSGFADNPKQYQMLEIPFVLDRDRDATVRMTKVEILDVNGNPDEKYAPVAIKCQRTTEQERGLKTLKFNASNSSQFEYDSGNNPTLNKVAMGVTVENKPEENRTNVGVANCSMPTRTAKPICRTIYIISQGDDCAISEAGDDKYIHAQPGDRRCLDFVKETKASVEKVDSAMH